MKIIEEELADIERVILERLGIGVATRTDWFTAALGLNPASVRRALKNLQKQGKIVSQGEGVWAIAGQAKAAE